MKKKHTFSHLLHFRPGLFLRYFLRLSLFTGLMSVLCPAGAWGQTTVFTDDFNRGAVVSPITSGGTPTMVWTTASTASPAGTSTTSLTTDPNYVAQLIANTTAPAAGRTYITGLLSTFSSPFNTILSSNLGPVTWTFNMKTNRTTSLSGFDATNYGSSVVLTCTNTDFTNITANGYAVVLVKGVTNNAFKLVRFANGLMLNSNLTTIIGPSPELASNTRWASIKVVYTPSSNIWQLFMRDDGSTTEPQDPTTGTLPQVGSNTVNSTYTSDAMSSCGFFWNHSNGAYTSNKGMYDNFTVVVIPVITPTLNVIPSSLSGFNYITGTGPSTSQSYSISGVNLDGSQVTVTGSTNYEVSTNNSTFSGSVPIPYSGATLTATPVYVRLKAGLPVGNYNSENLINAGGNATAINVICSGFILSGPATYLWTGATDNNWTVASNWSPARTSPVVNDILQFNNGGTYTITNVPTQTIAQLLVSAGTKTTLQADAPAALTIAGTIGDDLAVAGSSSELNISGANALTITLNSGTNGLISGSMTFSGAAQIIKSADANSLIFANGSICKATTGFTGNLFGTTNLNSVTFQAGSTYIQDAGSNPFGAGQPSSVITFETGSLYKCTGTAGPSYSGRTYANFECDQPTATQNNQGSSPFTCDNYTVTSGIVNWDFSGSMTIKGNIYVSSIATLTFGKLTKITNLTLSGSSQQTIAGAGFMDFGPNGMLIVNNAAGAVLNAPATLYNLTISTGTFKVASGASLITNGTVSGSVNVERFISIWGDYAHGWHHLSSPVISQAIRPGFVPNDPIGSLQDFYAWDEPHGYWFNCKDESGSWVSNFDAGFIPGKGYLIAYASNVTKTFSGALNVSDVSITGLTNTPSGYPSGSITPGWHLLGNPFPSALTWGTSNWGLSNITATAKIWEESSASYIDLPATTGIIPAMNGFMVETSGNGSLTIPIIDRVHSALPWFKSTGDPYIKLVARNPAAQTAQESVVTFDNRATPGYDPDFDSHFLPGYAPSFYSVDGTEKLSTNVLPGMDNQTTVPFNFIKTAGSDFTIEAVRVENVPAHVYLTDLKLNKTQNMGENPVYSFTSAEGDDPARFLLSFSHVGLNENSSASKGIYAYENNLYLVNPGKAHLEVYSFTGQKLLTEEINSPGLYKTALNCATGYCIVRLTTGTQVVATKVFIR